MAEQQTNLHPFYRGWEEYQKLLIAAIAPLSPEQLALRPAPHLRTIGENVAHIIGTRVGWFHLGMGMGEAAVVLPFETWDAEGAPARSAAELVHGLEITWQMVQTSLAHWTPADLDHVIPGPRRSHTRQWIIWHVIEHDLHHGGEVSFTLGMYNLAALDL
ncbi:MAG TPA: DinB family protein [Ktedonobacteraceae bacterium]